MSDDSLASPTFSRREFLGTALAVSGFAASSGPLRADTISTDTVGLETGAVMIGEVPAYFARPTGAHGAGIVLVVQEIFGVHEHIRDICRRLAKLGYVAVAPELYVRQGDPTVPADIPTLMSTIVSKVPDAQVMADLDAAAAWAGANGGDANRLGITGFCWGGRITWLYSAHNPKVKAGVAWYGRLIGQPNPLQPTNPVDVAASVAAPVLGLYGGADTGISLESVETMRAALAGKPSQIIVYDGAPHAFFADYRTSYRAEAALDGWTRLISWFGRYLD